MTWLVNIAYLAAAVLYFPVLVYQWTVQKKNRRGWRQRFGRIRLPAAAGPRVWVHAVSLGEINCTPRLVRELTAARPDLDLVVSTTTDTGFARACQLYPSERVFRFPLDLSWVVRRAMDRIRPDLIVLVELEAWPNLVANARRRGVPVAVVNGRLTARSARRLGWAGAVARQMFASLHWVGAQDGAIAQRFVGLGVPPDRVTVTGSLKWDTAEVADAVAGAAALEEALGLSTRTPLWVCGSTGPGEEAVILDAYDRLVMSDHGNIRLAIVPRKPERFDEVAALIRSRGFNCLRRSECSKRPAPSPSVPEAQASFRNREVVLGDTMGELRKFYSLATVVFVGRSLAPMGGSDPMEVAALGKPILCGPYMDNFAMPVAELSKGGGLSVVRECAELADGVRTLTADPLRAAEVGGAGKSIVLSNQGATGRSVEHLLHLIQPDSSHDLGRSSN